MEIYGKLQLLIFIKIAVRRAKCRHSRSRSCTRRKDLAVKKKKKKQLRNPARGMHSEGYDAELEPWRGSLTCDEVAFNVDRSAIIANGCVQQLTLTHGAILCAPDRALSLTLGVAPESDCRGSTNVANTYTHIHTRI